MTTLIKLTKTIQDDVKKIRDKQQFEQSADLFDEITSDVQNKSESLKTLNEFHIWLKTLTGDVSALSGSVSRLTQALEKLRTYLEEDNEPAEQVRKIREVLRESVYSKVDDRIQRYKEFADQEWEKYIKAGNYPPEDLYAPYRDHPEHGDIVEEYTRYLRSYGYFIANYPEDEGQQTQFKDLINALEKCQDKLPEPPSELIQQFVEAASNQYRGVSLKTYDQNIDEIRQWLKDNNLTSKYVIVKKGS